MATEVTPTETPTTTPEPTPEPSVEPAAPVKPETTPTVPSTPSTPEANTGAQTAPTGRVFTQAELDRILASRLSSERAKYADYETLQSQVQTQLEQVTKTQKRIAELEEQNQLLQSQGRDTVANMALVSAASSLGIPGDAAIRLIDRDKLQFDDGGKLVNATTLITEIAEKYPGLASRPPVRQVPLTPPGDSSIGQTTDADRQRMYFGGGANTGFWQGRGVIRQDSD